MKIRRLYGLAALVLGLNGIAACNNDTNSSGDKGSVDMLAGDGYGEDFSKDNKDLSGLDFSGEKYDFSGSDKNDLAGADLSNGNDLSGSDKGDLYKGPDLLPQLHPIAILDNCNETDPVDGLCVYRLKTEEHFFWDASPSSVPLGRNLVWYFIYADLIHDPNAGVGGPNPKLGMMYRVPDKYSARLEVTDNTGDTGTQDFYNIVSN